MADMPEPDPSPRSDAGSAWWRDLRAAAALLTVAPDDGAGRVGAAAALRAFPVVGLGLGVIAAVVYAIGLSLHFHEPASAVLAIGAMALLTGARHEIGFAAFLEGLASSDHDTRRAIAAQGRLGERGILVLLFDVALRIALVAAFDTTRDATSALVAAAAASRAAIPVAMHLLQPAAGSAPAAWTVAPSQEALWTAGALGIAFVFLFLGPAGGVLAAALGIGAVVGAVWLVRRLIGGHTPTALSFIQQGVEITVLAAALIVD
ncbi:MAG: adenosylcobinamide-GDP ribazoletransferase [Candidatus Eiseniibacteriota bacterium]